MEKVLEWINRQEMEKKKEEDMKAKIGRLQSQVEEMAKDENRRVCQQTGVNMFAKLDALQGEGAGVSLAAKAQTAMLAANTAKRKLDEDKVSEGESLNSTTSHSSKNRKLKAKKSGLAVKSVHKILFEVEWAHHWLGKEFEANPVPFNQLKLSHYLMGEANILLVCTKPEEMRARLKLMTKMGYWQLKYDWPSARNVYAAILRGIETGRKCWEFDIREYEDMLVPSPSSQSRGKNPRKLGTLIFVLPTKGETVVRKPPTWGKWVQKVLIN